MNMTLEQLDRLSARDSIAHFWGVDVLNAIDRQHTIPLTREIFLSHCTACGGNWNAMLLSGIKALYPEVYAAIPDDMGYLAFRLICDTMELLQVKGE